MNEDTRQKMVFLLSIRSSALAIVAEADWSLSSSCFSWAMEGTLLFAGADSGLIGGGTFDGEGGVDNIGTTLVDDMVGTTATEARL